MRGAKRQQDSNSRQNDEVTFRRGRGSDWWFHARGVSVVEGDVDGMADRMLRLVREPELAAKMGAAGRRHIEANYRMEESLSRLRSTLVEVARNGS
mgnify:CR=1 FL=1